MPHVSKHQIEKEVYANILSNFIEILATLKNKKESGLLIKNLLTKTEILMLSKRLGMIFLLREGMSGYKISQTLKVSESTVSRISCKYEKGEYQFLERFFKSKKLFGTFIKRIINLLPKRGRGRWDFLDKTLK